MAIHFENLNEGPEAISYVIQKNYSWWWTNIKTIPAKKIPAVYDTTIAIGYGYYRIRINKISGTTYSKNVYVAKY